MRERLCDFLGQLPSERKVNFVIDDQILKTWKRDEADPAKVTLTYLGDANNEETFVPARFREAEPAQ